MVYAGLQLHAHIQRIEPVQAAPAVLLPELSRYNIAPIQVSAF